MSLSNNTEKANMPEVIKHNLWASVIALSIYPVGWFIFLRDYGFSSFLDYSGWFWFLVLPFYILFIIFNSKSSIKTESKENNGTLLKIHNKMPAFFKVNLILFLTTLVYNFFWIAVYLPLCENQKWSRDYGCLAWRFDILITLGLMILSSLFNQIYFVKNRKYFSIVFYLVVFVIFLINSLFNIVSLIDIQWFFVLLPITIGDIVAYVLIYKEQTNRSI